VRVVGGCIVRPLPPVQPPEENFGIKILFRILPVVLAAIFRVIDGRNRISA